MGTKLDIALKRGLGASLLGGEGFILQCLEEDGLAVVKAGGAIVGKELKNETLHVSTGRLATFTRRVDYDIEPAGDLKPMILSCEGLFLATVQSTDTVSYRLLPKTVGDDKGEGSVSGGI